MNELEKQLIRDEGIRLKPYRDTKGKLTIGAGRNLDDVGVSKEEAFFMLDNDINAVCDELTHKLPFFSELDEARQGVLINMAFNMGVPKLLSFENTLAFIAAGKYEDAAKEMLLAGDGVSKSPWYKTVGIRAERLAEQLKTGTYQ